MSNITCYGDISIMSFGVAYEYMDRTLASDSRVLKRDGSAHYIHVGGSTPSLNPGDPGTDVLGLSIPEARMDKLLGHYSRHTMSACSFSSRPKYHVVFVRPNGELLSELTDLVNQGKIHSAVGKIYKFNEISNAHDEVEKGHALGKVVVEIED